MPEPGAMAVPNVFWPPPICTRFELNVQFVTVGSLHSKLTIPPPCPKEVCCAEFSSKTQFAITGSLNQRLYIPPPPPFVAAFRVNRQAVMVGLLL